jgi:cellulase/cellobiase CelA1
MRNRSGWAGFNLGAASTLALLVAALEVSVAAIPMVRGVDPASVNRTFKGDRSPALPGASLVVPGLPLNESEPKLPEGCIAEADWRGNIYSDEVAGRCLA